MVMKTHAAQRKYFVALAELQEKAERLMVADIKRLIALADEILAEHEKHEPEAK